VEKRWKHDKKRVGSFVLKLQAPAHEPGDGSLAAAVNYLVLAYARALDDFKKADCLGRGQAAQDMGIASREDNEVAG
jgi:hypothetical protein